ncbi:MAG: CUB domain-containing protein, partial [Planctomycetes bacterium]|nr:CUB domain-containing protein [Planctomycetota bacterium]
MLKSVIISIAVLAVTGAPIHLRAATVSASIVDQTGDPNAVFVSPGDTFEIAVRLDTTESLISGEFRIQDLSQSGIFTLESVSFNDADWNLGVVLDPTVEPLTSVNGFTSGVFGSIADDLLGGIGSFDAAIVGVSVDPLAADGNYLLNLSDLVFGDLTFNPISSVATGQDYLVVVPEPASGLFAIMGLGILVRRRSRQFVSRFSRHKLGLCVACASVAFASTAQASDPPPQYFMDNNTIVTCEGRFFDSGGPKRPFFTGQYSDTEDFVKTFIPTDTATEKLRFEFIMFDIEPAPAQAPNPFDRFEIYNGSSTNAPLIGVFFPRVGGGGSIPGTITSSAPDGSLTFRFVSDNIVEKDGWEAKISCVPAYSVAFQNSGQSMWGPGTQAKPRDSDRVEFLTLNHNDFRPDRNVVSLAGRSFGAGVFAGVTGDLGFQIRFDDIGPGSVGIRYPIDVTLAGPTQDDFRAGDLVTIKTSFRVENESGPYVNVASPDLKMKLDARANITANATAEACVFDCQSFNMFPSVNLGGHATIVELDASGNSVTVVTQQLPLTSTPFDIPVPIEALTGIGGNLDTPNMAIPPNPAFTTVANGRSLVASGSDQFTTLSMDIDTWILRALQTPPALKLEIPEIPIFSLFGRFTIFGSFLIMDLKVDTDLHQEFTYSFTPTVHIAFEFPQPVQFTVRRNGTPIHSGTSTVIQLDAGDSVDLIAPDD